MSLITTQQFDDFLDEQILKNSLKDLPEYPSINVKNLFYDVMKELAAFHDIDPVGRMLDEVVIEQLMHLQLLCTCCHRYLEYTWRVPGEFAGRIAAVVEVDKSSRSELRRLRPGAQTGARAAIREKWLKAMPQQNADALRSAKAAQNWDNATKIKVRHGGKTLGEHYWKEIFDPYHRPPYAVGELKYKELFDEWLNKVTPFLANGVTRNPNYDDTYRQNFFDFLGQKGRIPAPNYQYKYLSRAEKETAHVIVRGGVLIRKRGGQLLDTSGWQLNNPDKDGNSYEGSAQSMADGHGIWVMSPEGAFYTGRQCIPTGGQHHSAFLSGAAVKGAGEWLVQAGVLKVITGNSGHYAPTFPQFQDVLRTLSAYGLDLGKIAAEWTFNQDPWYFNAKQLSLDKVKAKWNDEWPNFDDRPLRPILPLNPTMQSGKRLPFLVDFSKPYDDRYLAPPRKALGDVWNPK